MSNNTYTHCLDLGHGGADPGAVGKRSHEADIVLNIGKIASRIMIEQGQKVILTRTSNTTLSLAQRATIANNKGCKTFTSIHCNAATSTQAHGAETWSYPGSAAGLKLSKLVQAELINATKLTNRGCKTANFGVLRMTKMTAILVETAFISNVNEENLLLSKTYQEAAALAIVKGIFKYLGLTFKVKVVAPIVKETPVKETIPAGQLYKVQTGAYSSKANADREAARLKKLGIETTIKLV